MLGILYYYLTHCNTAKTWSWCTVYLSSIDNGYPAIYVIICVGEKNGKIKIVSSFSAIKLCFVVNLFNLGEYPLSLANSAYVLVGLVSSDIPRDFAGSIIAKGTGTIHPDKLNFTFKTSAGKPQNVRTKAIDASAVRMYEFSYISYIHFHRTLEGEIFFFCKI